MPLVILMIFLCLRRVTIPPFTLLTIHSPVNPWAPMLQNLSCTSICCEHPTVTTKKIGYYDCPLRAFGLALYLFMYGANRLIRFW
jgi:hypothetical protein